MCPHTTKYVSSYYYICVYICVIRPEFHARWSGTASLTSYSYIFVFILLCVLILLYMLYVCPHATTIYVSLGLSFTRDGVGLLVADRNNYRIRLLMRTVCGQVAEGLKH